MRYGSSSASRRAKRKMRIELVVIREGLGTKTIDFKGKGRLDLN
jgi:hypothetical protein